MVGVPANCFPLTIQKSVPKNMIGCLVMENPIRALYICLLCASLNGCAFYHPKPITEEAVGQILEVPDLASIRVQAAELKHPLLKPVELDEKQGLTPEGAAVLAVLANPALKAARAKKGVAAAQLLQAGILPNPQFSYEWNKPTGGDTEGTVNAFGMALSWDLIPLLVRPAQVESARAAALSVDLDIAWQEWQIALAAKAHVYNLVFLGQQLRTALGEQKALEENLAITKKAYESGDVTEIDLSAAQTALSKVDLSVLALQQQHEQERLALNQTIGFPPDLKVLLTPGIRPPSLEAMPQLDELMEGLKDRRLDLVALRYGYQSQEARFRAAILAQFPSLALGLLHARDTTNVITTGYSIAVQVPIFNRNQGQIAIERANRQQLFDEYLARFFDARATIASTLADMRAVEEQIDEQEAVLPAVRKLVTTYRIALLEGHADVVTYYNAVNDLYSRQIELLNLKRTLCTLIIAVETASGRFIVSAAAQGDTP